jgi:uncharacterized membrane protein (UPF0127 family)
MLMKVYTGLILAGLMISGCHAQPTQTQFPEKFELVHIRVGASLQQVQLADTEAKRRQGLMGQIPLQHGMLLLHQTPKRMVLWMKNTPSALDVAFIDSNWTIVGLTQMLPFSEDLHESPGAVIGALEMPLGWFAQANIAVGQQLTLCKTACELPTNSKLD